MRGDIEQWLSETIHAALLETNTAIPAVVEEWNSQDDTVKVKVSIKRKIGLKSEIFGELVDEQQVTDILEDVPCYRFRNGIYAETMPIEPGDRCMLIFQQRNINCWWVKGDSCNPVDYHDTRKHHLSDAVAMFGMYPQMDFIPEINLEWPEKRTIDNLTRAAMKVGEGIWHQDDVTHQRVSRDGYEVWKDGIELLQTLIDLTETLIKKTKQLIIAFEQLVVAYDQKQEESTQMATESESNATAWTESALGFTTLAAEPQLVGGAVYAATASVHTQAAGVCSQTAATHTESATVYRETSSVMQDTVDILEEVLAELEVILEKFITIKGSVAIPEPEVSEEPEPSDAPPGCGC